MKKINISISGAEVRLDSYKRSRHVREVYFNDFLLNFRLLGVYSRNHSIEANFNSILGRDRSWLFR